MALGISSQGSNNKLLRGSKATELKHRTELKEPALRKHLKGTPADDGPLGNGLLGDLARFRNSRASDLQKRRVFTLFKLLRKAQQQQ